MTALTPEQIRERIAQQQSLARGAQIDAVAARYRYVKPFAGAAEALIETTQNTQGRFMLGLSEIDLMMRGVGRGELAYITGRAHSGKTQVLLNAVRHNPDRHIIWFTPDEIAELVLSKLVAMHHGIDSETMEQRIKDGDPQMLSLIRRTAETDYSKLVVVDESLTLGQMHQAVKEAEDYWGAKCDAAVVDFLELIPGDAHTGDSVREKSKAIKRWSRDIDAPTLCLHQSSRTHGKRGQSNGMDAMAYGGETEAIFVLEVYRRRDDESLDEWEAKRHRDTISVAVHKNKRPPCKTGEHDYHIDAKTGLVRPLTADDLAFGEPVASPQDAWSRRQKLSTTQKAIAAIDPMFGTERPMF